MNTHKEHYERQRMGLVTINPSITVSFNDNCSGAYSLLDRSMPPPKACTQDLLDLFRNDISTADVKLVSSFSTDSPEYYTPYAVTFTYNADVIHELIKGCSNPIQKQWTWFQDDFTSWLNLFRRRCKAIADNTHIACYEIYPELTKAGTLHAHGLIYINNKYPSISHIMSKAWVDKTRKKGNSMMAMKKKNYRNSYDYAFAICNNVNKWRQYITKEQPNDTPCLVHCDPMEIDMEC